MTTMPPTLVMRASSTSLASSTEARRLAGVVFIICLSSEWAGVKALRKVLKLVLRGRIAHCVISRARK